MELSMNDLSRTSNLPTYEDSPNAISSRESACGASPCEKPDGPTTGLFGQAHAHVNLSASQARSLGFLTSGTFGRRGTGLSANARKRGTILSKSLESRLRVRTDCLGSTLFKLTWKQRVTPSRRKISALRASVRRIYDKDYSSWPSPNVSRGAWHERPDGTRSLKLAGAVQLTNWRSPQSTDGEGGVMDIREGAAGKYKLRDEAHLASWGTPNSLDTIHRESNRPSREATNRKAGYLTEQIQLVNWATPSSRDYKDTAGMSETGINPDGSIRKRLDQLPRQVLLMEHGQMPNGFTAETKSSGQLNPAHSRWLMQCPKRHDICSPGFASWALIQMFLNGSSPLPDLIALAVSEATEMPSSGRSRRRSLKAI